MLHIWLHLYAINIMTSAAIQNQVTDYYMLALLELQTLSGDPYALTSTVNGLI